jgi:hypothetical protein
MTSKFGRPDARIKFGASGKPGSLQKQVKRDEIGELELTVIVSDAGRTRINFNKPLTYLELQADKAYDLAHLILEHTKDKQGGEPVNVTEEKILDALTYSIVRAGILGEPTESPRNTAAMMLPYFMQSMAGAGEAHENEAEDGSTPAGEAQA